MTPWEIYWITRLDGLHVCLLVACVLAVIALWAVPMISDCVVGESPWKHVKKILAVLVVLGILKALIPDTKEMLAIYVVPHVATVERGKAVEATLDAVIEAAGVWAKSVKEKK